MTSSLTFLACLHYYHGQAYVMVVLMRYMLFACVSLYLSVYVCVRACCSLYAANKILFTRP